MNNNNENLSNDTIEREYIKDCATLYEHEYTNIKHNEDKYNNAKSWIRRIGLIVTIIILISQVNNALSTTVTPLKSVITSDSSLLFAVLLSIVLAEFLKFIFRKTKKKPEAKNKILNFISNGVPNKVITFTIFMVVYLAIIRFALSNAPIHPMANTAVFYIVLYYITTASYESVELQSHITNDLSNFWLLEKNISTIEICTKHDDLAAYKRDGLKTTDLYVYKGDFSKINSSKLIKHIKKTTNMEEKAIKHMVYRLVDLGIVTPNDYKIFKEVSRSKNDSSRKHYDISKFAKLVFKGSSDQTQNKQVKTA